MHIFKANSIRLIVNEFIERRLCVLIKTLEIGFSGIFFLINITFLFFIKKKIHIKKGPCAEEVGLDRNESGELLLLHLDEVILVATALLILATRSRLVMMLLMLMPMSMIIYIVELLGGGGGGEEAEMAVERAAMGTAEERGEEARGG